MKTSNIVDKTVILTTKTGQLEVASLPKHIRYSVETLDRYNQKRMDILCSLEEIEFAIQGLKTHIGELVTETINAALPKIESPEQNNEAN
jgi:hypothetical protein